MRLSRRGILLTNTDAYSQELGNSRLDGKIVIVSEVDDKVIDEVDEVLEEVVDA